MSGTLTVQNIDHVELFVPDRRQAAEWYRRVLGLQIVREFEHWAQGAGDPLMIACGDGQSKLALFEGEAQGSRPSTGIRRIAFGVDAAGFLQFLEQLDSLDLNDAHGRRITRDRVVDHEQSFSLYFTDPWGTPLELTCYDTAALRGKAGAGESG